MPNSFGFHRKIFQKINPTLITIEDTHTHTHEKNFGEIPI